MAHGLRDEILDSLRNPPPGTWYAVSNARCPGEEVAPAWHTEYMGPAVDQLREAGCEADAEVLAHISPARSSVVNYFGSVTVDYERELAQLDDQGNRALHRGHRRPRSRATGAALGRRRAGRRAAVTRSFGGMRIPSSVRHGYACGAEFGLG